MSPLEEVLRPQAALEFDGFLRTRQQLRERPELVFDKRFRDTHRPLRYSMSEALYAGLLTQGMTFVYAFLFPAQADLWDMRWYEALLYLFMALIGGFAFSFVLFLNWAKASLVGWLVPFTAKMHLNTKSASRTDRLARDVYLYVEGTYGFWGRICAATIVTLNGLALQFTSTYPINPDFLTEIGPGNANILMGAVWLLGGALFLSWIYFSIVDGFFAATRRYYELVLIDCSGASRFWFWTAYILLARILLPLLVSLVLLFASGLLGFAILQGGHAVRWLVGLEPVVWFF